MTILSNIAIVLVFVCIAQLVLVADCHRGHGKKGRKDGSRADSGNKERAPKPPPIQPIERSDKGHKPKFNGKFTTKDKTHCTWVATGQDTITLAVNCKKGGDRFNCEYKAIPLACPEYASRAKVYWKQIARSLKKQKALCKDPAASLKAGMCRRAPKAAHFKLSEAPIKHPERSTDSPSSTRGKLCADYQKQRAEEYCSESWSSVCNLFFSMIQGGEEC